MHRSHKIWRICYMVEFLWRWDRHRLYHTFPCMCTTFRLQEITFSLGFRKPVFLLYSNNFRKPGWQLLWSTIQLVLAILISLLVFDFLWYGAFTVTIFNFLKVNIIDNIASAYGTHQFGWYTTQVRKIFKQESDWSYVTGVVCYLWPELHLRSSWPL